MQFVFALRKKKVCIIQEHLFFKYMLLIKKENNALFLSLSQSILISPLPIPKKQSALKKIKIQLNDEVTI